MGLHLLYLPQHPLLLLTMSPSPSSEMDFLADGPENRAQTPSPDISANPRPMLLTTPQGFGSGVRSSYDDDKKPTDTGPYQRTDYDAYIEHDLRNNRVFMHADKFMELVFKTPANWEADSSCSIILPPIIAHADFQKALKDFLKSVKDRGHERRLYPFIVSLYAVVLKLLDQYDPLGDHDRESLKLAFSQNDPVKLVDGVIDHLSPDIRALFDTFTVNKKKLSFANVVHVVEVKNTDYAMCRGDQDFRVLNKGEVQFISPCEYSRLILVI